MSFPVGGKVALVTGANRGTVAGIVAGNEEIFPDPVSRGMGAGFLADPKGVEREVAKMVA